MFNNIRPQLIGICGGSASGKTTISNKIKPYLEYPNQISMDNYFINTDFNTSMNREDYMRNHNFDTLDSFNVDLFINHLEKLKNGKYVDMPIYDYSTSTYTGTTRIYPSKYILVDGIMILATENLRKCFDFIIYVSCNNDIRYSRRLSRDTKERGADFDLVKHQLDRYVMNMHKIWVEPGHIFANIVIDNSESKNNVNMEIFCKDLTKTIKRKLYEKDLLSGQISIDEMC